MLTGNGGDNWVWGGSDGSGVTGNDILSGGGGNDLRPGRHRQPRARMADPGPTPSRCTATATDITAAGVTVSLLLQGAAQATEQGAMTLTGFENLSGSNFDDALTGNNGDNLLAGYSGADTLSGGKGDDILLGDGVVVVDTHGTGGSGPIVTIDDVSLRRFPETGRQRHPRRRQGRRHPQSAAAATTC